MSAQSAILYAVRGFLAERRQPSLPRELLARYTERFRLLDVAERLEDSLARHLLHGGNIPDIGARISESPAGQALADALSSWRTQSADGSATITLRGEIVAVPPSLDAVLARSRKVTLIIDSHGGDGNVVPPLLQKLAPVLSRVEIVHAASAAALIATLAPCHREMHAEARMMLHPAQALLLAGPQGLRAEAERLERLETLFEEWLTLRTGQDRATVDAWFSGGDKWFSADEAQAAGLVDRVLPAARTASRPDFWG